MSVGVWVFGKASLHQAFQKQYEGVNAYRNGFCIYGNGITTNETRNSKQSFYGTLNGNKHVTKSKGKKILVKAFKRAHIYESNICFKWDWE